MNTRHSILPWHASCFKLVVVCGVLASALSCTPSVRTIEAPLDVPKAFSKSGTGMVAAKWWTVFDDRRLNALIDRSLKGNFTLKVAWDRLAQARATAAKSGAALLPSLDGTAGASRSVVAPGGAGRVYTTTYSLGLAASYEADLWGRVRSARDAAALDVLATNEDLHAAAVTLTAEVARAWYQLVESRGQLKLLDEQIKTNTDFLDLVTVKFRRGQVSATDVLQQRQLVESTKGERVQVESTAKTLAHRLAILSGRPPGSLLAATPDDLPALPPLPRTGVPAEWIRTRPDVRAAELRVQAADRRVAAAIADRFPKITLSADLGTASGQPASLFSSWFASMAAGLTAPLFDAGLRRAEVERTRAVVSELLNAYAQAILTSLEEVENALTQEAKQAEYVATLQKQLDLSRKSTAQTRENYTKGTMDFTRYLTTLLGHQRLQRTHLRARRQLVEFRISLYRALGRSWELKPSPRVQVEETHKAAVLER